MTLRHVFAAQLNQPCWLALTLTQEHLIALDYANSQENQETCPLGNEAENQIKAYLKGRLTAFDLPIQLEGSVFSTSVWQALLAIPYGQRVSYKEIATQIGRPKAMRAVGSANRANPLPLIIPCHRVVAQGKALAPHYSFGGVDTQQFLLALEMSHGTL